MTRSWWNLLAAGLLAWTGAAQPPAERQDPGAGADASAPRVETTDEAPSPDQVRRRVQRRLDEIDAERGRLLAAMTALDEGRPAPEALRELGPEARRLMDWRGGQRRPGGPDGLAGETDAPPPTAEEVRAFIDEHLPDLSQNLSTVERMAPGGSDRILERLTPRIAEVIVAQRRDHRLGELKVDELEIGTRVIDASRRAREAAGPDGKLDESEQNALRTQLVELLDRQARIRDAVRLREIELLEERAAEMRAEVQSSAEHRDQEIARLADRMIEWINRGPGGARDRWRDRRSGSDED